MELDLETFSPALKLHVGIVSDKQTTRCVIKQIQPPAVPMDEDYTYFGEGEDEDEETEEVEPLEDVELEAGSVKAQEWRVIKW